MVLITSRTRLLAADYAILGFTAYTGTTLLPTKCIQLRTTQHWQTSMMLKCGVWKRY
ncbi:hypothetical protein OH492_05370 [Vibrio chagasii]|nr:hypothetical protein [Vibrio chagasii]